MLDPGRMPSAIETDTSTSVLCLVLLRTVQVPQRRVVMLKESSCSMSWTMACHLYRHRRNLKSYESSEADEEVREVRIIIQRLKRDVPLLRSLAELTRMWESQSRAQMNSRQSLTLYGPQHSNFPSCSFHKTGLESRSCSTVCTTVCMGETERHGPCRWRQRVLSDFGDDREQ